MNAEIEQAYYSGVRVHLETLQGPNTVFCVRIEGTFFEKNSLQARADGSQGKLGLSWKRSLPSTTCGSRLQLASMLV